VSHKTQLRIKSGVLDPVSVGTATLVRIECKQVKEVLCKLVSTKQIAFLCNVKSSGFIYKRILHVLLYDILDPINETHANNE
jgi:hypothetical protein